MRTLIVNVHEPTSHVTYVFDITINETSKLPLTPF